MSALRPIINAARIAEGLAERARIEWLRYCAASADAYIRECHRDGIVGTETLVEWAMQRDRDNAEIAQIEARRAMRRAARSRA